MRQEVEELVERRAEHIYKWSEGGQAWCDLHEGQKERWREYAILALDDPDLALIDTSGGDKIVCDNCGEIAMAIPRVIPLYPQVDTALKER